MSAIPKFHASPSLRLVRPCLGPEAFPARRDRRRRGPRREVEIQTQVHLAEVARRVQMGTRPEEVLDYVYESFRGLIPFVRIGCALLEEDRTVLRAFWARAEYDDVYLDKGYAQPLKGSSLEPILETLEPRILNDLETYLEEHPHSDSTRRVVQEGVRSSLTCPLVSFKGPLGFLFFSFSEVDVYRGVHVATFKQVAAHVAGALEKARMISDLDRTNRRLESVMRMVSHDLRTPLGVIRGFAELIQDGAMGPVTDDQTELLGDIRHEANRLLSMAQEMTDLRALSAGQLELDWAPVDLVSIARARVRATREAAAAKDITLELEAPERVALLGDARRLEQVADNLISNAVKYSPRNTTVRIVVEDGGDEVLFAVVDRGPGIPEAEQGFLFQEFGRTSVRPTGEETSTGLGLAIVRRLARAHGGEASFESAVGDGSTFWVRLPRVVAG